MVTLCNSPRTRLYCHDLLIVVVLLLFTRKIPFRISAKKVDYPHKSHPSPDPFLDWKSFGFGLNDVETDFIWLDRKKTSSSFSTSPSKCLVPMQKLSLHPSSTILNYGQSLFEGLKAFRRKDNSIVVFRPDLNAQRMIHGANRLLMKPSPSKDVFVKAVEEVVRANAKYVPPYREGSLYLRPLLFGSGMGLGVKPSEEITFCIYASPVGNYFKDDSSGGGAGVPSKCIRLQAIKGYARAAPGIGGCGRIKAGGNYAPSFLVQKEVRERGFDEALFLDALRGEYVEEAGASNFFAVFAHNRTIITPPLTSNTILPGITRASLIDLAQSELDGDWYVQEKPLSIYDLKEASEAFCCGTGASVTPVGCVSYCTKANDERRSNNENEVDVELEIEFGDGKTPGPITKRLYLLITGIQNGNYKDAYVLEKYKSWIHVIEP